MDSDPETMSDKDERQSPPRQRVAKPPAKRNGKSGKSNYSREELLSLFTIMERIQPIETEEWEQVQLEHSEEYPGREVESIRRKYNLLQRKKVNTSSPDVPPEILAAKRVKRKIARKATSDNFDMETGFSESPGGQDPTQVQNRDIPGSMKARKIVQSPAIFPARRPMNEPEVPRDVARAPASPALSVASSHVSHTPKNANQEFLDFMRMQMLMETRRTTTRAKGRPQGKS